jgi:hypothetical protein
MDIKVKEFVHVFIKIQGFIVLSIIMSQLSIYVRCCPSPTFKGFHKTRQGNPHLKQTLPWQNAPLKKPPELQMPVKRNTLMYRGFYPHWSRDSVSPVCGIFFYDFKLKLSI